ncbi:HYR domain-containing protein [Marixanthomonas ophiurae]|uniref:HYR domain-containing protein n=1 Tax=Marixanthomonas ophiurae TaxID=387659 RepID=A0A3E1Q7Q3_9FLAO|nr:HYR domain-containing protein [Marixanthomonas ophiurae]RFN58148.1 HYR domain-containing protein [Marixanthomonas ophiurae]
MKKITQMWILIALLCSSTFLFAQNEGSGDFPNSGTGPSFNLSEGANGFSGTVSTPGDTQDRFEIVLATGQSITSISATATGDTSNGFFQVGNESVSFPGGNITPVPSGPGTYQVVVSTNFSLGSNWSITVNVTGSTPPCNLTAFITSQTNVACNGASTGSITVSANNGTVNYDYVWSNGASTTNTSSTTNTITGLAAGNYSVTITDANGCTDTASATITQPTDLVVSASVNSNVSCNGGSDGSATAAVSGGAMPYSYSWSPSGGNNATATGLSAGTYTVTVTDANGCMDTANVTITEPTALVASASVDNNVSCNGGSDGSATAAVSGGAMPYSYSWSPSGGNNATATGLSAGTYTVTVTDANGCMDSANVTITEPTALNATITAQTNASCPGSSDGEATVSVNGGTAGYTYSWAPSGGSNATATGLSAGNYTVTVTDANGCTTTTSVIITDIDSTPPVANCNDIIVNGSFENGDFTGWTVDDFNDPLLPFYVGTRNTGNGFFLGATPTDGALMAANGFDSGSGPDEAVIYQDVTITNNNNILTWNENIDYDLQSFCSGCSNRIYEVQIRDLSNNVLEVVNQVTAISGVIDNDNIWNSLSADLSAYIGQTIRIAFWQQAPDSGSGPAKFALDNVSLAANSFSVYLDANGEASITVGDIDGGSTDNCGIASTSIDVTSFDCSNIGDNTVTLTVTDNSGNTSTCTTTVTVVDDIDPIANCVAPFTVQLDANGEASITAADINDGSTDNCAIATTTIDITDFDCSNVGDNTVTLTVTDVNGNSSTCTTTVTVEDSIDPTITCTGDITVSNDSGDCGAIVTYTEPTASDNCTTPLQAITMNGQTSPFSGNARGYHFQAPEDFIITGLRVPADASSGGQNIQIMRFAATPATFSGTSSYEEVLYYTSLNPATGFIPVTIQVSAGDIIGILGTRGTAPDVNSYTAQNDIMINGNTVAITRFGTQNPISTGQAPQGSYWQELSGSICRVEFEYQSNPLTVTQIAGLASGSEFPLGTTTNTFEVTDASGNTASCSFDVTVNDTEAPTANCVAPFTVQLDASGQASITAADINDGSTDNCEIDTTSIDITDFNCSNVGDNTVTLTVTDVNGNSSTCTTTVTVEDNIAPVANCVAPFTVQLDANGQASITAVDINDSSTDNCEIDTTSIDITDFNCSNVGDNTVTLTVTDVNGNSSTCTTTVTVEDNLAPVANCVAPFTVQLDANGQASITAADINDGSTDNCSIDTTAIDVTDFDCSNIGDNTVTLTVTDVNGNSSTCTTTVTVEDNIAPVANCVAPFTVQLDANGQASITATDINDGSTDNCGIDTTSIDITDFDCSNIGDNTVTLTVTDVNGNSNTCTTTVTVEDNIAPVVNCAAPFTVELDANGQASITASDINDGSTDNCGIDTTSIDITDFDCSNVGDNTVTLTVTDVNGNTSTCTTTVTVEDSIAPTIVCPADILASTDPTDCFATVNFPDALATDNCAGVTVAQTGGLPSGSQFPVGVSTVEYTATDANGNTSLCTFDITVEDNEAPIAVCENITIQLDEFGSASITAANLDGGSTDACGVDSIAIDQDTFDCSNVGDNNVTLTVTDVNGNVSTCTAIVTVEDITAPEVVCQDITVQLDATGTVSITGMDVDGGSTDACGIASYDLDIDTFDCSNVGVNTVELTVTDNSGNTATCTAMVTVEDNIAPDLVCTDFTLELGEDGTATLLPGDVIASNDDACGIDTTAVDITEFDCIDIGTPVTVQVFVSDVNGNLSTCNAVVTVVDIMAPVVTCPADQTVDPGEGNLFYEVPDYFALGEASATDNCTSNVTITSQQPAAGELVSDGIHTITLTAEDEYGNIGTCTFELTVESILGVDGTDNLGSVQLYPNPANNQVTLGNPSQVNLKEAIFYDLTGRVIRTINLTGMGSQKAIDISQLSSATYIVMIKSENGSVTKQLIKE